MPRAAVRRCPPQALASLGGVVLVGLAALAVARRPPPPPCEGGRFLVEGAPLAIGPATVAAIDLNASQATLDSACPGPATRVKLTGTRNGTKASAKWTSCPGVRGKVTLKGRIDATCGRLAGTLRARREKARRPFMARLSRCGDGTVDAGAGEECEPPASADCDAGCRHIPALPTTTTTTTLPAGLGIAITSPANLAVFNRGPLDVTGTVTGGAVEVACNEAPATLAGSAFTARVPLREGNNTIACVARDAGGGVATASISVTLDTTPPRLAIDCPKDGSTVTSSPLSVAGLVNDIVVGTVNGEQASVTCHGVAAEVRNRTFVAPAVALAPGPNTITCTGTDRAGNQATAQVAVTLQAASGARIVAVSGNNQTGPIGSELAAPLVVALLDTQGAPVAGRTVIFRVTQNDGTLVGAPGTARALAVATTADGRAEARLRLGTRAGAGNNQVRASAVGFAGEVVFTASSLAGGPARIVVDSGTMQMGPLGHALPRPFVAAVIDAGNNRLAGVPVRFTVLAGGGSIGGGSAATVMSDGDGRALAVLTLGPDPGRDNNRVEASFDGNPRAPVTFVASAEAPGDPAATAVSGVVLDNTNAPIPGVTLRIAGTALAVQADAQGQFRIQPAPVGHIHLHADGGTATRPGPWPNLAYELVTVAGRDNGIGMPIFLPQENIAEGLFVDETHGGTVTLADVPGFALTIAPGSATFPDGSRSGTVTVTSVHPDKVPMVPNFGMQPRFIVSIQPAGTLFEPPAAMTLPNDSGLPPGQKTEMYSFDHDLGQFVSIGTGTVSDDGSVVRSDPGVGILKGGWHCGGNPGGLGTCEHECDDGNDCTTDKLVGGQCQHTPVPDSPAMFCRDSTAPPPPCGGITIEIDESCMGRCVQGMCVNNGDRQGSMAITAGLAGACDKIFGSSTCMPADLKQKMQEKVPRTLKIMCTNSTANTGCGDAQEGSNIITITNESKTQCGDLEKTLRHEMQHLAGAHHTATCATDPVYGCDEKCYAMSNCRGARAESCRLTF